MPVAATAPVMLAGACRHDRGPTTAACTVMVFGKMGVILAGRIFYMRVCGGRKNLTKNVPWRNACYHRNNHLVRVGLVVEDIGRTPVTDTRFYW